MNQIVFLLMTLTLLLILSTLRIGWEEHGESVENRLCETDEITRCVWRGHTCINAFAAVRLMLPDDRWGIAAPVSLAKMSGLSRWRYTHARLQTLPRFVDFMVRNPDGNATVSLNLIRIVPEEAELISAEKYTQTLADAALADESGQVVFLGREERLLCGRKYLSVRFDYPQEGCKSCLLVRRKGDYLIQLPFFGPSEEAIEKMMRLFAE